MTRKTRPQIGLWPVARTSHFKCSTPLTMLCIQYQSATPGSVTPADGTILAEPVKW